MKLQHILLFILTSYSWSGLYAQEFNLEVSVNAPALKIADPKTIGAMEKAINEFFNETQWTNDDFLPEERIEGTLQINITDDPSSNTFVADLFINTGRPVFNSSYTTTIINHVDRGIRFNYNETDQLRDNKVNFTDNFSSILSFYAYIILGMDYDTFANLGGEEHFKTANNILANVPPQITSNDQAWTSYGSDRNRYWMIENILNPKLNDARRALYSYHLQGLDQMAENNAVGKAIILSALKNLQTINKQNRNTMFIQMFSNSKRAEILDIFRNSVKIEQRQVYDIMASIDPSKAEDLKELR